MAMDIFVFLKPGTEPETDYLNQKASELELNLEYQDDLDLANHEGPYSVRFNGSPSNFSVQKVSFNETISALPEYEGAFPESASVYHLKYNYAYCSPVTAYFTAAILATIETAVVFETQLGEYLSSSQLLRVGKQMFEAQYNHS